MQRTILILNYWPEIIKILLKRKRVFTKELCIPVTNSSDLLAASTSQKTAWLKYITFKSDTRGVNFPIESNL